jgi:predicted DNA-binding transcriptional regulator AlpA
MKDTEPIEQGNRCPPLPKGNGPMTETILPANGASNFGPNPLLVTARQAASMCGKSLRTWRTWDSAGWIPRPVRIGRSTLWRADEMRDWVAAGCPRRAEWEGRK